MDDIALHIDAVRLRAEAALVRRMNAGYGFADARIPAELYLRDDDARERFTRNTLKPEMTYAEQAQEIASALEAADAALAAGSTRLGSVAELFCLSPAERVVLEIAIAYELDADVRGLCQALAGRRRPALYGDVCQDIAHELTSVSAVLRALHPSGPLRRHRLILAVDERGSATNARLGGELSPSRRVLDVVLGDNRIAEPLHSAVRLLQPDAPSRVFVDPLVAADVDRVIAHVTRDRDTVAAGAVVPLVLIQGALGTGKGAAAHRIAAALGQPLAVIPLPEVLALEKRTGEAGLLRMALADARLRGAIPYIEDIEALRSGEGGDLDGEAVDALAGYPWLMLLSTCQRGLVTLPVARPFHLVSAPLPSVGVRRAAWSKSFSALGDAAGPDLSTGAADAMAARYIIGPGTISRVVEEASSFSQAKGEPVSRSAVEEAVGRQLTMRLGAFGTLITRRARFEEMVLPHDVVDTLRDMIAMVRERATILESWGYAKHLGLHRGVSAMFSGEPGTGKTMAASVVSGELGLELMRIDLSSVVSKWVGETEKHLARIFDEAQNANAMLLFDEADSLFGKRTELKTAQDRFANLEVNYILQRMESFDGVSILTTNKDGAIDQAFLRRLNFRVRFPEPEEDEREQLWKTLLPPDTEIEGDIDFTGLAQRFEMTGGHIRNAIVRAAVIAARQERAMRPRDLLEGAHLEYVELGKVMPSLTD